MPTCVHGRGGDSYGDGRVTGTFIISGGLSGRGRSSRGLCSRGLSGKGQSPGPGIGVDSQSAHCSQCDPCSLYAPHYVQTSRTSNYVQTSRMGVPTHEPQAWVMCAHGHSHALLQELPLLLAVFFLRPLSLLMQAFATAAIACVTCAQDVPRGTGRH